jgi:hypothetical protein
VTTEGLRVLAPLAGCLSDLNLEYCRALNDEGLRALSPFNTLVDLRLGYCSEVTEGECASPKPQNLKSQKKIL